MMKKGSRRSSHGTASSYRRSGVIDSVGDQQGGPYHQASIRSFFAPKLATHLPTRRPRAVVGTPPSPRRRRPAVNKRAAAPATPPTPARATMKPSQARRSAAAAPSTPPTPRESPSPSVHSPVLREPLQDLSTTRATPSLLLHSSSSSSKSSLKRSSTASSCDDVTTVTAGTGDVSTRKKKKKMGRMQQMYLDLGQRDFARPQQCPTCGMLFVHGLREDAAQHASVCRDYRLGVPFHRDKARVVWSSGAGESIVEIRPSDSSSLRKKVEQVKAIVDKELGFADASTTSEEDRDRTAYLYIGNKRVVGMVSAERIDKAYLLLRNRSDDQSSSNLDSFERSKEPAKAMLGIHQLWVHRNRRKQGVASKLVSASRERMIFGLTVPIDQLAFSSPTEAGIQFARHYVAPDHRVLVYDCAA